MAEAVISSIAGEIAAFLVPRALENVGKLCGVKRELKELMDIVSKLQLVLDHAEEQYHQIPLIRDWVEQLKDAFYEAHDVLEEFNIEALRRELRGHNEITKEVRTFFSSSNQLALNLKMSYKVRAVRERIEANIKASRGFSLEERPVDSRLERQWSKREETHSYICKGDIKGRDDEKKAIKEFLLDFGMQENVSVLPIVGIGGLGKTALAQDVYNDEMVSKYFQLKMWVFVSDKFDKTKIVKNMIACAKKKEPTTVIMEQLQEELRGEIDGKRYLLVLDDWWNEERENWLSLRTLLLGGARGSKILITTRRQSVAKITSGSLPLSLEGLSKSVAIDLLLQMAGRKIEEVQDSDMLDIIDQIVGKCSGVPLVVRTVGSLLFKKSKIEWSHFKDNELPDVSQREDHIVSVLRLSYVHLPSHLKRCFSFCSLFPKDYKIKKQTLIDLWMAEGYIQPVDRSQHLEDIAHGYFVDLLCNNFFQDYQEYNETCKMHDLMHDLACSVAGIECQLVEDDTKSIDERTRHISMGDLPISQLKASPLRTIVSAMPHERSEADISQLMRSFKRLHILDLHHTNVERVPRSIGKLKYLTYLDLSDNDKLKKLPNSITRLQNLQTLNLCGCRSLEELPRDIRKLVSLRNLDIDGCWELGYMPQGLGQLTSLHRLTRFILPKNKALAKNCCRLGELKGLNHIRGSLCIENLGSVMDALADAKDANLEGKKSLRALGLKWGDLGTGDAVIGERDKALLDGLRPHSNLQELTIRGYKGESFPRWMMDLPNLVELRLSDCGRCKHLPPLDRLSSLVNLAIGDCEELDLFRDESGNIVSDLDGPKSLRYVEFFKLPKLASLPRWLLRSNNLQDLPNWGCRNLMELPEQIEAPQSLQAFSIIDCNELDLSKDESGNIISDFHGSKSLRFAEFRGVPKLAYLPRWLLHSSNLHELRVCNCDNLKELSEQIEALQSLQRLYIDHCPLLTSLPEGIGRLSSLIELYIVDCKKLESSKDESGNIISDFHGLKSLRSVKFHMLPKLASLPPWLLQANNLQDLWIWDCQSLKELPEQIEGLRLLQRLEIHRCPSLTSLPEGMRRLTSLTYLRVSACPELEERCKRDAGEDWHKIAHVPHISHRLC